MIRVAIDIFGWKKYFLVASFCFSCDHLLCHSLVLSVLLAANPLIFETKF